MVISPVFVLFSKKRWEKTPINFGTDTNQWHKKDKFKGVKTVNGSSRGGLVRLFVAIIQVERVWANGGSNPGMGEGS